jgi:SIR2-like protein
VADVAIAPVLFLGAGASKEAGVPTTFDFVSEFEGELRNSRRLRRSLAVYRALLAELGGQVKKSRVPGERIDVELVLEALDALSRSSIVNAAFFDQSKIIRKFPPRDSSLLLRELREFIARKCIVAPEATEYLDPLRGLLTEAGPLDVFTVNYDVVFEQFLERWGYPYFDGFDLFWSRREPEPGSRVALYKLHGSVTWFRTASDRFLRLPVIPKERGLALISGEHAEPLMLYPAQKELYSGPYVEILHRLKKRLSECPWVFVAGYSFRDESLTRVFREAAAENPSLRLLLIGPSAFKIYNEKLAEVTIPISPYGRMPGALEISPSPLRGKVICLPYRAGAVFRELSAVVFPAIQEAREMVETAQRAEVLARPVDWRTIADKLVDSLWLDEANRVERDKLSVDTQDHNWKTSYFARKALALYSFGDKTHADDYWRSFERLVQHDVIETLRISPDEMNYGVVSPRYGFETTIIDGKPQGAKYTGGEIEYNLLATILRFATRVGRYSVNTGRETELIRTGALLERATKLLETFRGNQCHVRDYLRSRPEPHAGLAPIYKLLSDTEALPEGDKKRESWSRLAKRIQDYEIREFRSLPWRLETRLRTRIRKVRLGDIAIELGKRPRRLRAARSAGRSPR